MTRGSTGLAGVGGRGQSGAYNTKAPLKKTPDRSASNLSFAESCEASVGASELLGRMLFNVTNPRIYS